MSRSYSFLLLVTVLSALSACAAPSDVGVATEALAQNAVATRVGNQIIVLEDRLRHDVDGAPVMLFEIVEIDQTPYLVRLLDRGERQSRSYVPLRAQGDDFVFDPGVAASDCGWCHSDDGDCRACYHTSAGAGSTFCVCDSPDGSEQGGCDSTSVTAAGFENVFSPDFF